MLEEPLKTQTTEAAQVITDTITGYTQYITHKLTPKLERYRDLSTNQQTTRQKEAATTGIQLVQSTTRDITETTDEMQGIVTRLNEATTTDEALSALALRRSVDSGGRIGSCGLWRCTFSSLPP